MNDLPSISYTKSFVRSLAGLPTSTQNKFESAIALLRNNPADPRLHTKKLSGDFAGLYSIRIGRNYRALFRLVGRRTIEFVDIDDRKDIYR